MDGGEEFEVVEDSTEAGAGEGRSEEEDRPMKDGR